MCLAIPGEILEILEAAGDELPIGRVSFGGVTKRVCLAYVPEARIGDYVLVHAGFAIASIGESHAREMLDHISQIELEISQTSDRSDGG
jgi:hydrogenase expression/formation protein HypC